LAESVNDEMERMWKEDVIYFKVLSPHNKPVRIHGLWPSMLIQDFLNMKQRCHLLNCDVHALHMNQAS